MSLKQRLLDSTNGASLQQQIDSQVEGAQLQLQLDRLETKKSLSQAEKELTTIRSTVPYNTTLIIKAKEKVGQLKAGLTALDELEREDFPAEKD